MSALLAFGERQEGFDVPVLNEREVRAAAGILFVLALAAFMNAWLVGDFRYTRLFVMAFLIDFTIRIFINPRYAPSLILGRLAVRKQVPEFVGAPQKRFAWAVGWALAVLMLYLLVIERVVGPLNLIVCATCLVLMFFESAFGICLACKVYNLFSRSEARHCPGGVCEVRAPLRIQAPQWGVLLAFFATLAVAGRPLLTDPRDAAFLEKTAVHVTASPAPSPVNPDCTPPDWAVKMGHAEKWKLHHNCQ